jgi:hypothetical protein
MPRKQIRRAPAIPRLGKPHRRPIQNRNSTEIGKTAGRLNTSSWKRSKVEAIGFGDEEKRVQTARPRPGLPGGRVGGKATDLAGAGAHLVVADALADVRLLAVAVAGLHRAEDGEEDEGEISSLPRSAGRGHAPHEPRAPVAERGSTRHASPAAPLPPRRWPNGAHDRPGRRRRRREQSPRLAAGLPPRVAVCALPSRVLALEGSACSRLAPGLDSSPLTCRRVTGRRAGGFRGSAGGGGAKGRAVDGREGQVFAMRDGEGFREPLNYSRLVLGAWCGGLACAWAWWGGVARRGWPRRRAGLCLSSCRGRPTIRLFLMRR